MNDRTINRMLKPPDGPMTNVLAPPGLADAVWEDGAKSLIIAPAQPRNIAQNLIDTVGEHGHLKEAKVLLLFKGGIAADADFRIELGKAKKATPLAKFLSGGCDGPQADFIVYLNAEQWPDLDKRPRVALVDHQLSHCGCTIGATRFVPDMTTAIRQFEDTLGDDYLTTVGGKEDGVDVTIVRFRLRKGEISPGKAGYAEQPLTWRVRKHDVEAFVGAAERHGPWLAPLQDLVDVWMPDASGQLDLALAGSKT